MARCVVYLKEQERNALYRLAERELRAPKAQAALIIRAELERLGMLSSAEKAMKTTQAHAGLQEAPNDIVG